MATQTFLAPTPLTFELPSALVARIHSYQDRLGLKSASEVVRHALASFDYASFQSSARDHCQISVRLAPDQKKMLFRCARQKKVSAGELLRAALEALAAGAAKRPAKTPATKKSAKARK
jgi:hypothetical protein